MKDQKGNVGVIIAFIIVVGIIGLVVYSLIKQEGGQSAEKAFVPITNNANTKTEKPVDITKVNNQTSNKSMEPTTNLVAKNGDTLVMNYTGRLTDGTVFDSNVDPKFGHVQPFEFKLGAGQVIKGWDEGLVGMKVGEKKTLTIPPEKGYGSAGAGAAIPPNATLIFDVELLGIK